MNSNDPHHPVLWRDNAACLDRGPQTWYEDESKGGDRDNARREQEARTLCRQCSVKTTCLEFALETREKYGIWGGLDPREREALRRRRKRRERFR